MSRGKRKYEGYRFDGFRAEAQGATTGGSGGGVPEAPTDGKQYGRQNSTWTEIAQGVNRFSVWRLNVQTIGNISEAATRPAGNFTLLNGDNNAQQPRIGDLVLDDQNSLEFPYTVVGVSGTNISIERLGLNDMATWYSTGIYQEGLIPSDTSTLTIQAADVKLLYGDRALSVPRQGDSIRIDVLKPSGAVKQLMMKVKNVSAATGDVDAETYYTASGSTPAPLTISPDDKFLMDLASDAIIPRDVTMDYEGLGGPAAGLRLMNENTGEEIDWLHIEDFVSLLTNWNPNVVDVHCDAASQYDGVSKTYSIYLGAGFAGSGTMSVQKLFTFTNQLTCSSTGTHVDFNDPITFESLTAINTWWHTAKAGMDPSDPQMIAFFAPDDWDITSMPPNFDDVLRWDTGTKSYTNNFDTIIRAGLIWDGSLTSKTGLNPTDRLGGALQVDVDYSSFSVTSDKNNYYKDVYTDYKETVDVWQDLFKPWVLANPTSVAEIGEKCSVLRCIINENEDIDWYFVWSGPYDKTLVIENNTTSARNATLHFADPEMDIATIRVAPSERVVFAGCRDGWVKSGGGGLAAVSHNNTLSGDGTSASPLEVNKRYVYGQNDTGNVIYGVGMVLGNATISENGGQFRIDCPSGNVYTRVSGQTSLRRLAFIDEIDTGYVHNTGNENVGGVKTFTTLPESSIAPTTDAQLVNKKYVDDCVRYIGVINGVSGIIPVGSGVAIDIPDGLGVNPRAMLEVKNMASATQQGVVELTAFNNYSETTDYMVFMRYDYSNTQSQSFSATQPLNAPTAINMELWQPNSWSETMDIYLTSGNDPQWTAHITLVATSTDGGTSGDRRVAWHIEIMR